MIPRVVPVQVGLVREGLRTAPTMEFWRMFTGVMWLGGSHLAEVLGAAGA